MTRIDLAAAVSLPRKELVRQLEGLVAELLVEHRLQLNRPEQDDLVYQIVNDMMGLGPLEPLLEDEAITDIMINGPKQIYIERAGKLDLTSITFEDNTHLLNICNRIVSRIGRRVDESSPICDARLLDGSRVNIIIPPLAIDGASVSIRKFGKRQIGFDQMAHQGNISAAMATVLRIASRCRLNIVVSGGTGSGKTTLLNALVGHDRQRRARGHHRGRGRAAHAAAACRAARDAAGEPRGQWRGQHARPREERAAHAARPHHPGRGARTGGDRSPAGHEHRP